MLFVVDYLLILLYSFPPFFVAPSSKFFVNLVYFNNYHQCFLTLFVYAPLGFSKKDCSPSDYTEYEVKSKINRSPPLQN